MSKRHHGPDRNSSALILAILATAAGAGFLRWRSAQRSAAAVEENPAMTARSEDLRDAVGPAAPTPAGAAGFYFAASRGVAGLTGAAGKNPVSAVEKAASMFGNRTQEPPEDWLRRELGPRALIPPSKLRTPAADPRSRPIPAAQDGSAITAVAADLAEIESIGAPEAGLAADCRRAGPHWHGTDAMQYFHDGALWGRWAQGRWTWLERSGGRWWLWGPKEMSPLVRHQRQWWYRAGGVWFALHTGLKGRDVWFLMHSEWKDGRTERVAGTQIFYSPDFRRVGVLIPGQGASLFDSSTSERIARWPAAVVAAQ